MSKTELQCLTLAKGANPIKLHDQTNLIKAKSTRAGLICLDSAINSATIQALSVNCQWAIRNTLIKAEIQGRQLNLEILIQESRQIHEMRNLVKET